MCIYNIYTTHRHSLYNIVELFTFVFSLRMSISHLDVGGREVINSTSESNVNAGQSHRTSSWLSSQNADKVYMKNTCRITKTYVKYSTYFNTGWQIKCNAVVYYKLASAPFTRLSPM